MSTLALQLVGGIIGVNLNSTADQAITFGGLETQGSAPWLKRFIIPTNDAFIMTNASVNLSGSSAAGGIYTAASKGGTAIVAASQLYTAMTAASKLQRLVVAAAGLADIFTLSTPFQLFFSLTTAHGSAATADLRVYFITDTGP